MWTLQPLLLLLLLLPLSDCRELYISASSGDDRAAGDASHPWRSLARLGAETLAGGDTVHLAAGDTWHEPLVIKAAGAGCEAGHMRGFFEKIVVDPNTGVSVVGWVVDPLLPGSGRPAVPIQVTIDGKKVQEALANISRPDLPAAGVAPDADHGFNLVLSANVVKSLQHGTHQIHVMATSSEPGCGQFAWEVTRNLKTGGQLWCVCEDGRSKWQTA